MSAPVLGILLKNKLVEIEDTNNHVLRSRSRFGESIEDEAPEDGQKWTKAELQVVKIAPALKLLTM